MANDDLTTGDRLGCWTLSKPMTMKDWVLRHVWYAQNDEGRSGIVKVPRDPDDEDTIKRFEQEVRGMRGLQNEPGVLPLLDADSGSAPGWMVTAPAVQLDKYFGEEPDFRAVVHAFADLAAVLETLKGRGIAHRDLKPANLFWLDERAVIGDFGIANWPDAPSVTSTGEKVGPRDFMAPETKNYTQKTKPHPADVFSLAKSLWSVAAGGAIPPEGRFLPQLEEIGLQWMGGQSALELGRLLDMATTTQPGARPSMAHFHEELEIWLSQHAPGSCPRVERSRIRGGPAYALHERKIYSQGLNAVSLRSIRALANSARLKHDDSELVVDADNTMRLGDFDDAFNFDPDMGLDPDWAESVVMTWPDESRRLVVGGVREEDDIITFLVEWQARAEGDWKVTWSTHRQVWLDLPSERELRANLGAEIMAHRP